MLLVVEFEKLKEQVLRQGQELASIKHALGAMPSFLPISTVFKELGYKSTSGLIKKLNNGDFEPDIEFRQNGRFWEISISAYLKLKALKDKKLMLDKITPLSMSEKGQKRAL